MDKKQLHHLWTTKIRPIKVWYLLVLFLLSTAITIFALRANDLRMVELRQEVYTADKENGDVEGALQNLRAHVYAHMNTELSRGSSAVYPPIQLKYTYQRLLDAEQQRVQAGASEVYTAAQRHCEQQNPTSFSGGSRIGCVEQYISEHRAQPARIIPDAMYKFDFVSPSWSPDLAGFSLVLTVALLVLLVLRIIAGRILRRL